MAIFYLYMSLIFKCFILLLVTFKMCLGDFVADIHTLMASMQSKSHKSTSIADTFIISLCTLLRKEDFILFMEEKLLSHFAVLGDIVNIISTKSRIFCKLSSLDWIRDEYRSSGCKVLCLFNLTFNSNHSHWAASISSCQKGFEILASWFDLFVTMCDQICSINRPKSVVKHAQWHP